MNRDQDGADEGPLIGTKKILVAACLATVLVLLVMFAALGMPPSRTDLLTSFATVVFIWTAAIAAENLIEIRRARLAEFKPIIIPQLPELIHPFGDDNLTVRLLNIGRGVAREPVVRIWRPEGVQALGGIRLP